MPEGKEGHKQDGTPGYPTLCTPWAQWKEAFNLSTGGPNLAAFVVHAVVPALPGLDPLSPSIKNLSFSPGWCGSVD